jgi:hypothetical protein
MLVTLRHLLSILLLPFLVVVIVPYGLLTTFSGGDNPTTGWLRLAGAVLSLRNSVL